MEFLINIPLIQYLLKKHDMKKAKAELMKMLDSLSDEALRYVWRPIAYAYYMTDEHGVDLLTPEDMNRFGLIASAANDPGAVINALTRERGHIYRVRNGRRRDQRE